MHDFSLATRQAETLGILTPFPRILPAVLRLILTLLIYLTADVQASECTEAMARFDYSAAARFANARLAQSPGDAGSLICLARSQYERGDFEAALISLQRTDGLAKTPVEAVLTNNWYGVTLRRMGQRNAAKLFLQKAFDLARASGDQGGLATAMHNIASMLNDLDRPQEALAWYQASLAINPDAAERSASLNNMGLIVAALGRNDEAEGLIRAAIDVNRQGGHFHHLGKHLMNLGNLLRRQGRFDEAGALIGQGQALVEKAGDRYWIGVGHRLRAWLAQETGHRDEARREYDLAAIEYGWAGTVTDLDATHAERAALGR